MADITYPTSLPLPGKTLTRTRSREMLVSKKESGVRQTRPRFTAARMRWKVQYVGVSTGEMLAIEEFFESVEGGVLFNWEDPHTGEEYEARCLTGEIEWRHIGSGLWNSNQITIEEEP